MEVTDMVAGSIVGGVLVFLIGLVITTYLNGRDPKFKVGDIVGIYDLRNEPWEAQSTYLFRIVDSSPTAYKAEYLKYKGTFHTIKRSSAFVYKKLETQGNVVKLNADI